MKPSRAHEPGGMRELIETSYPLILSTASSTVMQFINRVFLAHYGPDELAACVPAGLLSFVFACFFVGTASYTNAFVSQYHGRGKSASVSVAVWQGVWLAIAAGLLLMALTPLGYWIISVSGHPPAVIELEKKYFLILNSTGIIFLCNVALSSFFTGRGLTKVPMMVNMAGNALCVLLSWSLIFGKGPMPELGMTGAAWAMVAGQLLMLALYLKLALSPYNRARYRTSRLVSFHRSLFLRLIKYGAPNGVGFFLDIAAFAAFIFIVGAMDKVSLAASNIIASLNQLAFMPMIGLGMAALTLVGRYIGMRKPDLSVRVSVNAVRLAALYGAAVGALFFAVPGLFVNIFGSGQEELYAAILAESRPVMRVLAVFIFFDAIGIVYADALRGAGDTRFQMLGASAAAWILFVPGIWYITHGGGELIHAWAWAAFYIFLLALFFWLRWRSGLWRRIDILKK
ncbi:MAG TPA: MATE family efflux transporter [Elusimicrobia bacterium]|nr:MATE family efflux transporter [Elusimicrobiota bacterium]